MNTIQLLDTNVIHIRTANSIWLMPIQANVTPNSNSVILGGNDADKKINGLWSIKQHEC